MYSIVFKNILQKALTFFDNVMLTAKKHIDSNNKEVNMAADILVKLHNMPITVVTIPLTSLIDTLEEYRDKAEPYEAERANKLCADCTKLLRLFNTYSSSLLPRLLCELNEENLTLHSVSAFIRATEALKTEVIAKFNEYV